MVDRTWIDEAIFVLNEHKFPKEAWYLADIIAGLVETIDELLKQQREDQDVIAKLHALHVGKA